AKRREARAQLAAAKILGRKELPLRAAAARRPGADEADRPGAVLALDPDRVGARIVGQLRRVAACIARGEGLVRVEARRSDPDGVALPARLDVAAFAPLAHRRR